MPERHRCLPSRSAGRTSPAVSHRGRRARKYPPGRTSASASSGSSGLRLCDRRTRANREGSAVSRCSRLAASRTGSILPNPPEGAPFRPAEVRRAPSLLHASSTVRVWRARPRGDRGRCLAGGRRRRLRVRTRFERAASTNGVGSSSWTGASSSHAGRSPAAQGRRDARRARSLQVPAAGVGRRSAIRAATSRSPGSGAFSDAGAAGACGADTVHGVAGRSKCPMGDLLRLRRIYGGRPARGIVPGGMGSPPNR